VILIYLDESGTNYTIKDGLYVDGPFLIMGAMCIYEDVYWNMERLFIELIEKYFGIDNWLNNEIHATDIWAGKSLSSGMTTDERREFFDDFLQLCGKFGLPYVFSFNLKCIGGDIEKINRDMIIAAHCLLTNIEHKLAEFHQTGVLICDTSTKAENLKLRDIVNIDIKQKCLTPAQALLMQFHAMTSWRSTTSEPIRSVIQPKYEFETKSAYLIDRVHFLHSDDSLFLQMCDIMTFIIQRALVYDYLLVADINRINPDKLPITKSGLAMMKHKLFSSFYGQQECDVIFTETPVFASSSLLHEFGTWGRERSDIIKHYKQMQPKVE
jgi:hypothetical protein